MLILIENDYFLVCPSRKLIQRSRLNLKVEENFATAQSELREISLSSDIRNTIVLFLLLGILALFFA